MATSKMAPVMNHSKTKTPEPKRSGRNTGKVVKYNSDDENEDWSDYENVCCNESDSDDEN